MNKPRYYLLLAVLSLGTMLAACGDNTATPAPTPTAIIPREATLASATPTTTASSATTAAATPRPTTTAAATVKPTTAAPVTTSASTPASTPNGNSNVSLQELRLPVVPGFTSFPLSKELLAELSKELNNEDVLGSDPDSAPFVPTSVGLLGTDIADPDQSGTIMDASLHASGYTFGIPGYTTMLKLSGTLIGVYTKAGSPDLIVLATPSKDFVEDNDTQEDKPLPAELLNFAKSKKYIFIVAGGTDLVKSLTKGEPFPTGMPTITKK